MFCKRCGYQLTHNSEGTSRCPECGLSYDPKDQFTYARSFSRTHAGRKKSLPFIGLILLSLIGVAQAQDGLGDEAGAAATWAEVAAIRASADAAVRGQRSVPVLGSR